MTPAKTHIAAIAISLEAKITFSISCSFCGEDNEYSVEYGADDRFFTVADYFMREGWRQVKSDKYGCIGLACPGCIDDGPNCEGKEDLEPYLG